MALTETRDGPLGLATMARGDRFIEAWQGAPFAWDGRSADGVDCWGLLLAFHDEVLGITLPDWRRGDHGRAWVAAAMADKARSHWHGLAGPVDGSIVMAMVGSAGGNAPRHVGICWRGGIFHASDIHGVKYERLAEFAVAYPRHEFGIYIP